MGFFSSHQEKTRWAKRLGWCGNWTPFQVGAGQRQLSLSWPPTWVPAPVSLAWAFAQRSLPFYSLGAFEEFAKEIKERFPEEVQLRGTRLPSWPGYTKLRFCP